MRRLISILLILLAVSLLAGCNAVRLTYNNAETLTYWWLDGYVGFTAEQKPLVQKQLAQLHNWHREAELPQYIQLLERVHNIGASNVSAAEVCDITYAMRDRAAALNARIVPIAAALGPTLSEKQIQHIRKELDDKNKDWRDKWLDDDTAERLKHRLKETIKQAENFYGDLTPSQRELLRQRIQATGFDPELVYAERLRRQDRMLNIFRNMQNGSLSGEHANAEIKGFMQDMTVSSNPAYRAYIDHVTEASCITIAALHNTATADQRAHAAKRLRGYIDDLTVLEKAPAPSPH